MNTLNNSLASDLRVDSRQLRDGIMSMLILVLIAWMAYIPISHHMRLIALQKTGITTAARVKNVSLEQRTHRGSRHYSETYTATVTFFDKGKFIMGNVPVTVADYDALHVGQQLRVIYMPGDPSYCRFAPITDAEVEADNDLTIGQYGIVGFFVMAGLLLGRRWFPRRLKPRASWS
jgi:hypothetical protein